MIYKKYSYVSSDVNTLYYNLCRDLLVYGKDINGTKELLNIQFTLTDPKDNIIRLKSRKTSKRYLLAENVWYAAGKNDVAFIGKYAGLWNRITDDGVTSNSAYGYIMQKKFGFDQIEKIIEMLSKTPDNRRAVIVINDPNENIIETKDEQCTMYLQFFIRDNKLHLTANMRSNDIISGLTNDIAAFTALQQYVAKRLNIEVGEYTHFDGSLHIYDRDIEKLKAIVEAGPYDLEDPYTIDWIKLYENADLLYSELSSNTNSTLNICRKYGVLKDIEV